MFSVQTRQNVVQSIAFSPKSASLRQDLITGANRARTADAGRWR